MHSYVQVPSEEIWWISQQYDEFSILSFAYSVHSLNADVSHKNRYFE